MLDNVDVFADELRRYQGGVLHPTSHGDYLDRAMSSLSREIEVQVPVELSNSNTVKVIMLHPFYSLGFRNKYNSEFFGRRTPSVHRPFTTANRDDYEITPLRSACEPSLHLLLQEALGQLVGRHCELYSPLNPRAFPLKIERAAAHSASLVAIHLGAQYR